jgi:hypothetical protein
MTPAPLDESLDADELPDGVDAAALQRMDTVTSLLDDGIKLPGVNVRLGIDPVIGLLPVAGDTVSTIAGLYLVAEAVRLDVSTRTLAWMLVNLGVDFAVGSIPVVGDVFDVFFKANRRNLNLVLEELGVEH